MRAADEESLPSAGGAEHAFMRSSAGCSRHAECNGSGRRELHQLYPGLNRDLVIAGIFLHDIAKTWELSYDSAFGYTDGGQLVGHIVKSAMWINDKRVLAEETLERRSRRTDRRSASHHPEPSRRAGVRRGEGSRDAGKRSRCTISRTWMRS